MPASIPSDFIELVERSRRGRLKVYLGSAPGIGKTYRMLQEAHTLARRGVDVVLAVVETRRRPETEALLNGIEAVPRRRVELRGVAAEEMDLAAVLARRPQVAIVDDLAHVNPPGSVHLRRHQDVRAMLEAGISVIGAVDVLHLESLNDLVERLTGLKVRDTIPDTFLRQADQVVNLDLSVEDLMERLEVGKIHPPERMEWARRHVHRPETLASLRELALREVAEVLDRGQGAPERVGKPAQVSGRVMVCLSSLSPRAATLLRRGSRFAGRLSTDWFVVYVETPEEAPDRIDAAVERQLLANVEKARELGAEVVRLKARDPARALLDFARSHGIATILVGRSQRPWWKRVLRPSPAERLVRQAAGFDLYVVAQDDAAALA